MNAQVTVIEPEELEYTPATTMLRLALKYQEAGKHYKSFKQTVSELSELFRGLESLDIECGFNVDNDYITMSFAGDGPKLTLVWRLLRLHGYNTTDRPKKGDTSFYAFWRQEGRAAIFMNFSSTMCRRIQVGTKMVETPVYETQCGDLPTADLEIEAPKTAVATVVEADDEIPF